jgi:hypothetical protein
VATLNTCLKTTTTNGRIYELIEEAISDHIGFLGLVEHGNIFTDEPNGRIVNLAKGWVWILGPAERGPSGRANIGGVGALISPRTFEAYVSHTLLSPRILAVVFKRSAGGSAKRQHRIHILVVYSYTATEGNAEPSRDHYGLLSNYMAKVPLGDIVILVGDFNATVATDPPLSKSQKAQGIRRRVLFSPKTENMNDNSEIFREFLDQHDLYPINTRFRQSRDDFYYTFSGPNRRRARLDYILVRGKWASGFRTVMTRPVHNQWSDHKMIIARGKWRLSRQERLKGQPRLDFSVMKDPKVAADYLSAMKQRYQFNNDESLDDSFAKFINAFNGACAEVNIPYMTKRQRRVPWEDYEVANLRQARQDAKRHFRRNRSARALARLRQLTQDLSECYKERQEAHILDMCDRIGANLSSNKTATAYQLLNDLCGKRGARVRIAGDTASDRLISWFEHFSKVVFGEQTGHLGGDVCPLIEPVLPADVEHLFNTSNFTVYEIEHVISTMSGGKASGVDEIPVEVYKIPGFAGLIIDLLNAAFNRADVPQFWRTLIVVPVPKKSDLSKVSNYRGISLMCIIAKIYNKAILFRVRNVLDSRLDSTQNGFRPNRSTIPHIVSLREMLRACIADGDMSLVIVFVDYTKAFDSVKWDQLRAILIAYRIPIKLVDGIMSLYKGAIARVKTEDGLTDLITLFRGVLQGDTLAPYLFVIVMDYIISKAATDGNAEVDPGLTNGISVGFQFPRANGPVPAATRDTPAGNTRGATQRASASSAANQHGLGAPIEQTLYADDLALASGGTVPIETAVARAQRKLTSLERSGGGTGLDANPTKTEALVVAGGQKVTTGITITLLCGHILKQVSDYPFLGSLLASETMDIKGRLHKGWAAVRRLASIWKSDMSVHVKTTLFGAICVTVFLYPSATWVLDEALAATLNGNYTRMLRFAKGLNWQDHPSIGAIYGDMPTVVEMVARRRLMMVGNVFQLEHSTPQLMARVIRELEARRVTRKVWANKVNRNFVDQLYEDLALVGLDHLQFEEVVKLMKKPKDWEHTVDKICRAYPRPARLSEVAGHKRAREPGPEEVRPPPGIGAFTTPVRKKRPSPNRSERLLRKTARLLGRREASYVPEYDLDPGSVTLIFREVQSTQVSFPRGAIPRFGLPPGPD